MSHVHVDCLTEWRQRSANPQSFYECDTCHFKYRFGTTAYGPERFTIARLLSRPYVVHALALTSLAALIFVAGFIAKISDADLTWYDVWACFNLDHLLKGAAATGVVSLIGWATAGTGAYGAGGVQHFLRDTFHRAGGNAGSALGTLLFLAAVTAGLSLALYWIYERLEAAARKTVRAAQHVVLDIGDDGGDPQPARAVDAGGRPRPAPGPPTQFEPVD